MVFQIMRTKQLFYVIMIVLSLITSNSWCQDSLLSTQSISIRAVDIKQYENSPLRIEGQLKWPKGIWKQLLERSIFTDTVLVSKNEVNGVAKVLGISYGERVVDIVFSMDSCLYEVISIKSNNKCDSIRIEIGKEYTVSFFPYYNYQYTMAYNRNEPLYLNGNVIWVTERKLDSNIYLCPYLNGVYYCPISDAVNEILSSVRFPIDADESRAGREK